MGILIMGIREIESMLKSDNPLEVAVKVQQALDALRAAIQDPNKDFKTICETSRALLALVDYADKCPEVWTDDRVDEVYRLLQDAAKAAEGHEPFHDKIVSRPQRFRQLVSDLRKSREATEALLGLMRSPGNG